MRRNCPGCYWLAIFQWMLLHILQAGRLHYSGYCPLYGTSFIILGKLEWLVIPLSIFLELPFQKVTHRENMIGMLHCSVSFCTFASPRKISTATSAFKKISENGVTQCSQLISGRLHVATEGKRLRNLTGRPQPHGDTQMKRHALN